MIESDVELLVNFCARFFINLVTIVVLVRYVYHQKNRNKDLLFTYSSFNFVIFIISYLLNRVDISLGAAFGLFAVFSMLRYRTEELSLKDMTYLFLSITVGLISSITKLGLTDVKMEFLAISIFNVIVLLIAFAFESNLFIKDVFYKTITYNNLDNIQPENETLLIEQLKVKTGLNIYKLEIQKIDFLKNSVNIKVYYKVN